MGRVQLRGKSHFRHCTKSTGTRNKHTIIITIIIVILLIIIRWNIFRASEAFHVTG